MLTDIPPLTLAFVVIGAIALTFAFYHAGKHFAHKSEVMDYHHERMRLDFKREAELAKNTEHNLRTEDAYQLKLASLTRPSEERNAIFEVLLRIFEKSELQKLDLEREKEEVKAVVEGAITLNLAEEQKLLDLEKLILVQLEKVSQIQSRESREAKKRTLQALLDKFNALTKQAAV